MQPLKWKIRQLQEFRIFKNDDDQCNINYAFRVVDHTFEHGNATGACQRVAYS